jgi:membrane protein
MIGAKTKCRGWERLAAILSAFLFTVGKYAIGVYLGRSSADSLLGAGGSLVVLLIWVYYSSQIVLFGAEFTHVYANHSHGGKVSQRVPGNDR